ncbi:MAG: DoxX family protein [Rivularia sp. (in: cyanobacteria)]
MKKIYYVSYGVVILWMVSSSIGAFLKVDDIANAIELLGYPAYFPMLLGIGKVIGILLLILPVDKNLKEWAFAGIHIELFSAIFSYALAAPSIENISPPIVILIIVQIYYWSRKHGIDLKKGA